LAASRIARQDEAPGRASEVDHGGPSSARVRFWLIAVALTSVAAINVVLFRGLYADGSYFLVEILEGGSFFTPGGGARFHAQVVTQLPVVVALEAGVRDLYLLAWLHSLGLYAVPIGLWLGALYMLRDDTLFWPFVVLLAVVYLNTSMFAIGEFHIAYAISAGAMAILVRNEPLSRANGWLLVVLALAALRSYEAMLFLGIFLALIGGLRLREMQGRKRGPAALTLTLAIAVFAGSALVAVWSVLHAADSANRAGAADFSVLLENRQLLVTFLAGLFYAPLLLLQGSRPVALLLGIGALAFVISLAHSSNWVEAWQSYASRGMVGFFMLFFGAFLALLRFGPRRGRLSATRVPFMAAIVPATLLVALLALDMRHSLGFSQYADCFRAEVTTSSGLVPFEATRLQDPECRPEYVWGWTNPSMSLLLRRDDSGAIVLNREQHEWQPFDPFAGLPDLSRYYGNAGAGPAFGGD
jgi:hypothetical protein